MEGNFDDAPSALAAAKPKKPFLKRGEGVQKRLTAYQRRGEPKQHARAEAKAWDTDWQGDQNGGHATAGSAAQGTRAVGKRNVAMPSSSYDADELQGETTLIGYASDFPSPPLNGRSSQPPKHSASVVHEAWDSQQAEEVSRGKGCGISIAGVHWAHGCGFVVRGPVMNARIPHTITGWALDA